VDLHAANALLRASQACQLRGDAGEGSCQRARLLLQLLDACRQSSLDASDAL
jgi:hypothetical protein